MYGSHRGTHRRNSKRKKSRRQCPGAAHDRRLPMTDRRRAAITGIGMVTPVGNDAPTTWANLLAGRSGVATIGEFDARGFPVQIGAEVKNFHAGNPFPDRKLLKFASRSN